MILNITRSVMRDSAQRFMFSSAVSSAVSRPGKTKNQIKQEMVEISQWPKIEDVAVLEYREYPYHITHYDPDHPDYIPDRKADYYARISTDQFNYQLDRLKSDLKMQREVDEAIAKLDRPYLRGKPGVTKNITGGLKEYYPIDLGFEQPENNPGIPGIFDSKPYEYHPTLINEKRWITQSIYLPKKPKYSNQRELERLKEHRPVTPNYHPDKGSKFDIEVPYNERYPYLADRLGHPEYLALPLERLMRLESDFYHPVYNDQPFLQKPPQLPHESLNFEAGEVLYENTRMFEWVKFWQYSFWGLLLWEALFMQYMILFKTHIPLEMCFENNFYAYHNISMFNWDYFKLHIPIYFGTLYYGGKNLMDIQHQDMGKYVVRAQYSKDRELLFVQRPGYNAKKLEERIYETQHLEILTPGIAHSHHFMTDQLEESVISVHCLQSNTPLWLYEEDKYWNPKLKKDFILKHTQLFNNNHYGPKRTEKERNGQAQKEHYRRHDETEYVEIQK